MCDTQGDWTLFGSFSALCFVCLYFGVCPEIAEMELVVCCWTKTRSIKLLLLLVPRSKLGNLSPWVTKIVAHIFHVLPEIEVDTFSVSLMATTRTVGERFEITRKDQLEPSRSGQRPHYEVLSSGIPPMCVRPRRLFLIPATAPRRTLWNPSAHVCFMCQFHPFRFIYVSLIWIHC